MTELLPMHRYVVLQDQLQKLVSEFKEMNNVEPADLMSMLTNVFVSAAFENSDKDRDAYAILGLITQSVTRAFSDMTCSESEF